jgi:TonB-dependent receptor
MDVTSYAQGDADHTTVNGKTENAIFGAPAVYQSTSVVSRDDLDLLPRLNIAFDVAENQKVRFSYTKTLTSLDANDLGRGTTYTTNYDPALSVFRVVGGKTDGNPNLAPWRSNNYDLSYEWYFDDASLVSIGLYRLEIQSSITNVTTKKVLADLDGVIRNKDGVDYTTKANAPGSVNQGFEVSYQQAYDFLPGVFSGLGSTLNYTYSQSESGDKDFYGKTMPMGDNSKNQFNAILWYQKDAWQARIAYNYRSERYRGISWNDGSPAAWWTAPTAYVDASVSYDINDHLTAYLQGTNITKEFEHTYMQWSDVMLNQSVFEARYTLGVRAKF